MASLLHHIVDRSAERVPENAAFRFDGVSLSYTDLVQRANGLAASLRSYGVQIGDRIGLLLPKSLEMPVAVFACLKAGAVVVPLDAQSPPGRLSAMIADADIRCLIASTQQMPLISKLVNGQSADIHLVIGPERCGEIRCNTLAWRELPAVEESPPIELEEGSPAYMLFTSGSTGQPKGILHSHRSALAYAELSADMYGVTSADRLGNFAPLHFDQSTFEFYTGPLRGATTVLIPQAYGIALASLANLIEDEKLTFWYSVPSVLIRLLQSDSLNGKDLGHIRWALFGGEVFPPQQLRKLMTLMPGAQFSNVYGPTEVNQCTCFNIRGDQLVDEALPIGKVWQHTEALIFDAAGHHVAVGDVGELLISSPTMMIGYWQRPDLNEQAIFFRSNKDGSEDRFYRTGDLVRQRPDGNLEFVGRKDRQIKTRGHRVELDEVEAVLCLLDGVEEAATVMVTDEQQMLLFDAVVRLGSRSELSRRDIAAHVSRHLPSYARPRSISILSEFPHTRTGKVDRNAIAELIR